MKPIKVTRKPLTKVGRGREVGKGTRKREKYIGSPSGEKGWQSVVTKRLVWQKRKYTGHARIEARNLVKPC